MGIEVIRELLGAYVPALGADDGLPEGSSDHPVECPYKIELLEHNGKAYREVRYSP